MKNIYQYKSPDGVNPVGCFINGLDEKAQRKIGSVLKLISEDANVMKPPYVKAFRIEKYKGFYELRARMIHLIRIIFYIDEEGDIILLHAFLKKHERSTEQALDISKSRVADLKSETATKSTFRED